MKALGCTTGFPFSSRIKMTYFPQIDDSAEMCTVTTYVMDDWGEGEGRIVLFGVNSENAALAKMNSMARLIADVITLFMVFLI